MLSGLIVLAPLALLAAAAVAATVRAVLSDGYHRVPSRKAPAQPGGALSGQRAAGAAASASAPVPSR
ncbi:MAG: hypothetical protein JWP66_638 [Naasia sp.]|nr:hypothetical protein [Naasia sp.]